MPSPARAGKKPDTLSLRALNPALLEREGERLLAFAAADVELRQVEVRRV